MNQAKYRAAMLGGEAIVLAYEIDDELLHNGTLRLLSFSSYSKDWAEFIFANRTNKSRTNIHDYDVVYSPIANDRVGIQLRNLMENNITLDVFLERLKYIKGITFQYFFGTDKAISYLRRTTL